MENQNYFRVYINTDNAEETQDEIYNILTDYEIGEVNNISYKSYEGYGYSNPCYD